jgi:hypothetical protein
MEVIREISRRIKEERDEEKRRERRKKEKRISDELKRMKSEAHNDLTEVVEWPKKNSR